MPNFISEDQIEKAAVSLLKDVFGYRTLNCFTQEADDLNDRSKRSSKQDLFRLKSEKVFELVYEYASKGLKWAA